MEVIFVMQLLRNIFFFKHPVMVKLVNQGALFIVSNVTTTSHTEYMDIRYQYLNVCAEDRIVKINEYVEDRVVKIIFVKSADNGSSILTKNLSADLHKLKRFSRFENI